MLHQVLDSAVRGRLLAIVLVQRRLVQALCALPQSSTVNLKWLQSEAWPRVDAEWVRRFWNNQKGRRQAWLNTVAGATETAKQELLQIMREQHRLRELYAAPATQRMQKTDGTFWEATPVREAMRNLMLDFYEPWLGQSLGYPIGLHGGTCVLNRQEYTRVPVMRVCPYCDNGLQSAELDHFLPKSAFPFLSIHPDNLIPTCHDSNRGDHKGDTPPLDWAEPEQTINWFHPRWRTARDRYRLCFDEQPDRSLSISLEPIDPAEALRVTNLDRMFRLSEFWGKTLDYDIQQVQKEVADDLLDINEGVSAQAICDLLVNRHRQHLRWIGLRPLGVYYAALYAFVATRAELVKEIERQAREDSAA